MSKNSHIRPAPTPGTYGYVCDDCAPKPDPQYAEQPLELFFGKYVKLGVPVLDETGEEASKEHMWFKVLGPAEGEAKEAGEELLGELNNDPVNSDMNCGDLMAFSRHEIEAMVED